MYGRQIIHGLLGLALLLCAISATARELIVAGTQFGRVFEQASNGKFTGLAVDLLEEYARTAGDTVRFELVPWPRAQMMVQTGLADILIGPYKTPERELVFAFSDKPFYRDEMVFYARAEGDAGWDGNYAHLKERRIAAIRGWAYGDQFDRMQRELKVDITDSLENGIRMLSNRHVDLLATNRRNTEALLPSMILPRAISPILPIIDTHDGYFAFPKRPGFEALRVEFDKVFDEMVSKGVLAKLALKHGVSVP
jgi:polar amino acid transport system substrate-binding protein